MYAAKRHFYFHLPVAFTVGCKNYPSPTWSSSRRMRQTGFARIGMRFAYFSPNRFHVQWHEQFRACSTPAIWRAVEKLLQEPVAAVSIFGLAVPAPLVRMRSVVSSLVRRP